MDNNINAKISLLLTPTSRIKCTYKPFLPSARAMLKFAEPQVNVVKKKIRNSFQGGYIGFSEWVCDIHSVLTFFLEKRQSRVKYSFKFTYL